MEDFTQKKYESFSFILHKFSTKVFSFFFKSHEGYCFKVNGKHKKNSSINTATYFLPFTLRKFGMERSCEVFLLLLKPNYTVGVLFNVGFLGLNLTSPLIVSRI